MAVLGALKFELVDVASGIQKLRESLAVHKYVIRNGSPSLTSPSLRSIPPSNVPSGPEYSNKLYAKRSMLEFVKPPVVELIAEGNNKVVFTCHSTPSIPWYYQFITTKSTLLAPNNPWDQPWKNDPFDYPGSPQNNPNNPQNNPNNPQNNPDNPQNNPSNPQNNPDNPQNNL